VRRQAEIDDHGEDYCILQDTPGIDFSFTLPAGAHAVSLYFRNDNGTGGKNRYRDWIIDIRRVYPLEDPGAAPWSARARVVDFREGVYKVFTTASAGRYRIHVHRNDSVNVMCSGFFIGRLDGHADIATLMPLSSNLGSAARLWLEASRSAALASSRSVHLAAVLALRSLGAAARGVPEVASWIAELNLWSGRSRADFDAAMKSAVGARANTRAATTRGAAPRAGG
jgi:hypothetical protein